MPISRDHYDDELVAEAALQACVVRIIAGKAIGRELLIQVGLDEVKGGKAGYVELSRLDLHGTEYAMKIVQVEAKGLKTQIYPQLQARTLHRVRWENIQTPHYLQLTTTGRPNSPRKHGEKQS